MVTDVILMEYDTQMDRVLSVMKQASLICVEGQVTSIQGTLIVSRFPSPRIGDLCEVRPDGATTILSEVVAFDGDKVWLSSLSPLDGIEAGAKLFPLYVPHRVHVGDFALGSVLDGFGRNMKGKGGVFFLSKFEQPDSANVLNDNIDPTEKPRISRPMPTGVKVIDALLTIGEGQRIGVFAGAGCGKTTLIAEIARGMPCDVVVFGLVGERGRELNEFIEYELDEALQARTILICATSDRSSIERTRAAFTATAVAEAYRDQGKKVLLLIDSLTRFARAQREIGLAAGEPPGRGGFPPSVATLMPRLLERAGPASKGSITAIYTVLIEQDSMSDPVADEARSLLDGHIILSRKLADKGHYPAIDVLPSLSRTMPNVTSKDHQMTARRFRELLAAYQDVELLLKLGEYQTGGDPLTDVAVEQHAAMMDFLQQSLHESQSFEHCLEQFRQVTC